MHKQLYQRQQEPRQATCFATKSERRRQQQQAEEDDKGEDVRKHSTFEGSMPHLIPSLLKNSLCAGSSIRILG